MQNRLRHSSFGLVPTIGVGNKSQSWSQYWASRANFFTTQRSGLELVDSYGGTNPSIQLPYLYAENNDEYARFVDSSRVLDIASNDEFTLCGWAKNETTEKTAYHAFAGKNVAGSLSGRYGIFQNVTTGYVSSLIQTSINTYTITSTIDHTDHAWRFLRMDVKQSTKKFRLFIDEIQIGADVDFLGTFGALPETAFFGIGVANANGGGGGTNWIDRGSYSDWYIYHKRLSAEEGTLLMSRGRVSGAVGYWDCVLRQDNILIDASGNGYHLTGVNLEKATHLKYGSNGSRQSLDIGYSLYENFPNKEIQIPYTQDGIALVGYTPSGYSKTTDVPGSVTGYNLADSYLQIAGWDRSNTTIFSYFARRTDLQFYYDADHVSWMHSSELTNFNLSNYFENDYRGLWFTKITDRVLTELIGCSSNLTGSDYNKAIRYTGETGLLKFDVIVAGHICAVNGAKMLKFDDVDTISLSLDYGATYPHTKVLVGVTEVQHAMIFDNGNIMFCSATKCYYSTDNLATYNESTVLDIAGDPFVASDRQNFRPWDCDHFEVTHDGVSLHTWGSYINAGTGVDVNINQWYTIDQGLTVKSGYKFHVSLPDVECRHIHFVKYDKYADKFYMGTGDDDVNHNNFMRGTYDSVTDVWTWVIIGQGAANSIWENSDFAVDDDYFYFTGELTLLLKGIRRSLKTDIANIATNQVRIWPVEEYSLAMFIDDNYYIHCESFNNSTKVYAHINFSVDGKRYISRQFDNIDLGSVAFGGYHCIGKLDNGYYLFQAISVGELVTTNYTEGPTLLIKPSKIEV
jgi:hypothetical protein